MFDYLGQGGVLDINGGVFWEIVLSCDVKLSFTLDAMGVP